MAETKVPLHDGKQWSAQAEEYAKLTAKNKNSSMLSPMAVPTNTMIKLINDLKPLSTATAIMDAGCGTGNALTELIDTYGSEIPTSARLIGSDFSEGMLKIFRDEAAKKAAAGEKIWSRLETEVLDMQDLSSVADGSLSHVFSTFVFGIIPDNRKAFGEVHRVLAPGGLLVEVAWSNIGWIEWIYEAVEKKFPGKPGQIPWQQEFRSEAGVKGLLEDANFEKVQVQTAEGILGDDDIKHFVTTFSRSVNPGMKLAFAKLSESELEEAEIFLEEELQKMFPDGKVRMKGEAIIAAGFKK